MRFVCRDWTRDCQSQLFWFFPLCSLRLLLFKSEFLLTASEEFEQKETKITKEDREVGARGFARTPRRELDLARCCRDFAYPANDFNRLQLREKRMSERIPKEFMGNGAVEMELEMMSMSRKMFCKCLLVLSFAFLGVLLAGTSRAAEPLPNVVMLIGDDMGWADYGFMGHDVVKTPCLDRLAGEGALFPNGYVPTSLCRASLATLLTGLYASQHKICCNDPPKGVDRSLMLPFLRDAPTIPRLLKDHGYRSLQTGKFWEGHFSNGGFTEGMTVKGRHGDDGLVIGRQTMQPIYDFITSCDKTPFFVWYSPILPHEPHNPPERILKKYLVDGRDVRQAKYWAMCEWFDETCGQLVQWIDDHGRKDSTLIVYVVDNGWLQTNEPVRQGDQFLTRSKNTPYEDGVRTPIILRRPGWIPPSRRAELVSTIDLAPTILAACGVPAPAKSPGLNLLPLVRDGKPLKRHDVFGEIYLHDCVELGQPKLSVTHRWIRHDDWKLIVPTKPGTAPELFRVSDDPHEKRDLASTEQGRVAELRELLDQRWNPQAEKVGHDR